METSVEDGQMVRQPATGDDEEKDESYSYTEGRGGGSDVLKFAKINLELIGHGCGGCAPSPQQGAHLSAR